MNPYYPYGSPYGNPNLPQGFNTNPQQGQQQPGMPPYAGYQQPTPFGYPQPYQQPYQQPSQPPASQSRPPPRPSITPKPHPDTITQSLRAVQSFATKCLETKCHFCAQKLLPTATVADFDVAKWLHRWTTAASKSRAAANLICTAECADCKIPTCLGCGRQPNAKGQARRVSNFYMDWCCRQGRMFAIWLMLARYDLVELQVLGTAGYHGAGRGGGRNTGTLDSRGIGYADTSASGFDPFQSLFYEQPVAALNQAIEFQSTDMKTDVPATMILEHVTEMIPSANNANLPPELRAMLHICVLVDKAADLLRNDSLEEVSRRGELYTSVIRFVEKLGAHPELRDLVSGRRLSKLSTAGLQALSGRPAGGVKELERMLILGEEIPSLAERLEQLARQSEVVLKYKETRDMMALPEGKKMVQMCKDITAIYKAISSQARKGRDTLSREEKWAKYHRDNCLVRDDILMRPGNYAYAAAARQISNPSVGRMKRLVTEIANMSTSLPPGIFVRVGESRPDIIRCLVMGHPDTPYAYGMFDFDIHCDAQYPNKPPHVYCRTAINHLQLSPNLHPDGKVCLSLLGTWHDGDQAAQWQPGNSTILSVLISIQAMVLSEDPWRQEPGYTSLVGAQADAMSHDFMKQVRAKSIKWAMLDWFRDPGMQGGIWREVIRAHFSFHRASILKLVDEWVMVDPGLRAWVDGGRVWDLPRELRSELGKLR
ncbi:hypothetical protein FQN55_005854 [Onygenales sp. PD_40]|nr:hypothetical protein FQN55_005854 [Onygenales sp. PD_40]KAK2782159.1 hypothetical protein FQN51_004666 [Onygenales sp. PD_10]